MTEVPFGPTGQVVYDRTYSRKLPDGSRETWPLTVARVARGNLELVYGPQETWSDEVRSEYETLCDHMLDFRIIPAGRHLWASGVKGRQYLFNCHVAGWGEKLSRHFEFTFLRLMEGGGVGANYSSEFLKPYGSPRRQLNVHIVCDPSHPDYDDMLSAGLLSTEYDSDWDGSFEVEDSREGWACALTDLIDTFMHTGEVLHANRVYDVSRVRGKGSRLKTSGGTSSGPEPFARMMTKIGAVMNWRRWRDDYADCKGYVTPIEAMEIDQAIAECVMSGGNRRSARMSQLPWTDPFIREFIDCKRDGSKHWTTNISVVIDNQFTGLLDEHPGFDLAGLAHEVHRAVVKGMLTNGEPGYWNIDLSNEGEPNPVIATNPCGEIALEAWENCNLGHVNLDAFAGDSPAMEIDAEGLRRAHVLMTRFLMRATYGDVNDEDQGKVLARNRRIGVGHLGVQGFLAKRGIRYSEAHRGSGFSSLLASLKRTVDEEAISYAHDLRIPVPVKTTCVAPTGSIAKLPGVTEGIHPIFARWFERRVRFSIADADQHITVLNAERDGLAVEVDQYDPSGNTMIVVYPTMEKLVAEVEALGLSADIVESADEIDLGDMLAFQAMYQRHWADNAVSFTVNLDALMHDVDEVVAEIAAWLPYLKGTTIMPDGTRPQAPYTRITREEYEAAVVKTIEDSTDEDCASGACPVR